MDGLAPCSRPGIHKEIEAGKQILTSLMQISQNFRTQLTPFLNAVGGLENLEFKWINGGHGVTPPEGFESYFGSTQLYRFIDFDGLAALDDVLFKIREMPEGESAEESIRKLAVGSTWSSKNITTTLDRLFQIIDEDPDIDVGQILNPTKFTCYIAMRH